MEYPKLRNVEIIPFIQGNKQCVLLRDPEHISEQTIIIPRDILFILRFFDGRHSRLDIRTEYMRRFGTFLFEHELEQLINNLNAGLMLDNDIFQKHRQMVWETFLRSPYRKARFAGQSYLSEPAGLKRQLNDFFIAFDGPGLPVNVMAKSSPRAIIAPHIDIQAGGVCYSHAYKILAESRPADLYVILGISHHIMPNLFSATRKHFETPLGIAETDGDFIDRLNEECGGYLFHDELAHRTEHTIEFQVIFLQHILNRRLKIAPILCSFDYPLFYHTSAPADKEKLSRFIRSLKKLALNYPGKVCFIASVDLAHIGPRYGDAQAPDSTALAQLKDFEEKIFRAIEALNADEFLGLTTKAQNRFRICGLPAIYTLLKLLETGNGELLSYARAPADTYGSLVSFASMVIY